MRCKSLMACGLVIFAGLSVGSTTPMLRSGDVEVTRASGGTIRTDLGHGIVLNEDSSLQREWIAVKHDDLPARLKGTPGVRTIYESGRGYSGSYMYSADFEVECDVPLAAIEVRFLTFDVWGSHVRTLSASEIADFAEGSSSLDAKWNLFSENEASEYYASIAYVASVRTQDGRVLMAPSQQILEEARKFSAKFSESDLDPKNPEQ